MTRLFARYRFVILGVAGLVLVAGWIQSEVRTRRAASRSASATAPPPRGKLGPTPGPNAEGYVAAKKSWLHEVAVKAAAEPAAALVSFSSLVRADDLPKLAGGAHIDLVFVRFPGSDPEALAVDTSVTTSLLARAERAAAKLDSQARQLETLAASASGDTRQRYLQQVSAKRSEAGDVRRGCRCVYAAVLSGTTLGSLDQLQSRPEVRLVDVPDPPVTDVRGFELTPLLPKA